MRHESRSRNPLLLSLGRTLRRPMGLFGMTVVLMFIGIALAAPLLAPYSPSEQFNGAELRPPSSTHLLGTDQLGRDLLSRIIFGTRASLTVGVLAVSMGATVGVLTGLLAGYLGGWIDAAIAQMPADARLTRAIVLSQRERDYVLAARSLGASRGRIMARHVLPNTVPPLLVQLSLAMGVAVLAEAALSYLGLGTQPPTPSWGGMLSDSRPFLRQAAWYGIWPGVVLALLLIALNCLADALRHAFDPRRINLR